MASDRGPGFRPDQGYTREDWDDVSDNPELTDEQLAGLKPLRAVLPGLVDAVDRRRGAQKLPTKDLISLRIDKDVLARFRESGPGWQSRLNDALRKVVGL